MRRFPLLATGALLTSFGTAWPAAAQQSHVVSDGDLDRLVEARAADAERDRATLARFLEREDVREAAAEIGVDVERAKDAVATLDDREAARLAERAREAEAALADDTIVVSTTAVIIALLVLILILVAD